MEKKKQITLKLTEKQFDILRLALECHFLNELNSGNSTQKELRVIEKLEENILKQYQKQ